MILPTVITVYADRSFTFILKSPPAAVLLKRLRAYKGLGVPNRDKVGTVTPNRFSKETKKNDLNAKDEDAAFHIIAGTVAPWV